MSSRLIKRRTILQAGAAVAALPIVSPFIVKARGETPVKIGWVDPFTGTYAALGTSQLNGGKMAMAELNKKGGILGREIQIITKTAPPMSVRRLKKLTSWSTSRRLTFFAVAFLPPRRWPTVTRPI